MTQAMQCGLITKAAEVPLEGVRIEATVAGPCVEVTVTQRYRNREAIAVEAVYVFPMQERSAVCGFAAHVGGKIIQGRVDECEAAFATYDDAIAQGDGAFLLEQEQPDVFTASVGDLRPGESVELQIRYVALATREGDALRLTIPTTVAPRYVPSGPPEVGEPDGERVNPPQWPSVPYGLTLSVSVRGRALARVESPSHPIRVGLDERGAEVELAQHDGKLDRDFVLLVENREPAKPEARVAREPDGTRVAMLTFLPRFATPRTLGHEVLFLLDCSGSMGGESIDQARRALSLCVRALGSEDTFNVVRFGSTFESLWERPRSYDDRSLDEASRYIAAADADLGGTEIFAPLTALLESKPDAERQRRVLLLTDGQVSNVAEICELARQHAGNTRIFAFGIGLAASEHLVRGMARASRGAAEMIHPGERIEPKVLRTFARLRTPAFEARVDWNGLRVESAPSVPPPVFSGDALTLFARIEAGMADAVDLAFGEHRFRVAIDLERAEAGGPIPLLWARERILELDTEPMRRGSAQKRPESAARRREQLVELGKRYGLMSSATSFVAVEQRPPGEPVSGLPALRKIPVAYGAQSLGDTLRVGSRSAPGPGVTITATLGSRGPMRSRGGASPVTRSAPSPKAPAPAPFLQRLRSAFSRSSPSNGDALYDVLLTQRADGSFPMSPELIRWLGDARSRKLRAAVGRVDTTLLATAVILAVLELDHRAREAEWTPAATKARAWLARQSVAQDVQDLL